MTLTVRSALLNQKEICSVWNEVKKMICIWPRKQTKIKWIATLSSDLYHEDINSIGKNKYTVAAVTPLR